MFKSFIMVVVLSLLFPSETGDYSGVIRSQGYAPSSEPVEIVEVHIPAEWDNVYNNYNALQKEGGFDLEPWKGRTCTRYTYLIPEHNARGNVLVYSGVVIGGDICSITLDGIMLPLDKKKVTWCRVQRPGAP